MAKLFLSFLGTGKYETTKYYFKDTTNFVETKFAQLALIKLFCKDFDYKKGDKLVFFLTSDSEKKHWFDFKKELDSKEFLFDKVSVPVGKNEAELWEIFNTIFNKIENNSELTIDITHGFRSLPMFLLVVSNFSSVLKNTTIKDFLYGAYEAKGETEFSPIFRLTNFYDLLNLTFASDNFLKLGDSQKMDELAKGLSIKENKVFFNQAVDISNMVKSCSGKELSSQETFNKLNNYYNKICKKTDDKNIVFSYLAKHILESFNHSNKDLKCHSKFIEIKSLVKYIKWASQRSLYQQAWTLLQETIISSVLVLLNYEYKIKKNNDEVYSYREDVRFILNNELNKVKKINIQKSLLEQKIKNLNQFKILFKEVKKVRNKINHCDFSGCSTYDYWNHKRQITKLSKKIQDFEKLIEGL